jgi:hypothetical protein
MRLAALVLVSLIASTALAENVDGKPTVLKYRITRKVQQRAAGNIYKYKIRLTAEGKPDKIREAAESLAAKEGFEIHNLELGWKTNEQSVDFRKRGTMADHDAIDRAVARHFDMFNINQDAAQAAK